MIRKFHASLIAVAVAVLASGATYAAQQLDKHPRVQAAITDTANDIEATRYFRALGFSCGVESWDIKVMRDAAAAAVNLTPTKTNIPTLIAKSGPSGARLQPGQAWQLTGTRLIKAKLESDSDVHLVLQSTLAGNPTMIAEIPEPGCAGPTASAPSGSRVLTQITAARAAFATQVTDPGSLFNFRTFTPPLSVTLVGIGFVDFAHGQTGADLNQIELHPVISFRRNP